MRTLDSVIGDMVALDPGAVIAIGDIVFLGAGANATAAADAFGDVDEHSPPMLGSFVIGSDLGGARANKFPSDGSGRKENEEAPASGVHYLFAPVAGLAWSSILGRCG